MERNREDIMGSSFNRRTFLKGTAIAAAAPFVPMAPAIAENAPVRVGLLTVKTGPLAEGGIQMEQGITLYLKEKGYKLAGRKIDFISADTGGNPAGAKTKAQELIERDHVDFIVGPLASFELLAISDYIAQHKTPTLSLAAAQDMTQRKPNPYFVRASATSSQAMQPLADYAAKEMKLKTAVTLSEDFAFGYEQMGGFQRVFEDNGGHIVKKLWPPIVTPDYTPYLAQIGKVDAVIQGFAGSNPLKFMKQYKTFGLKMPVLGGETAGDDALLKSFGDEAIGLINACPYSAEFESESNKRFVAGMLKNYKNLPGLYSAGLYINGMLIEAALEKTGGDVSNREKTISVLRGLSLTESPRGPFHFDHLGNVVGNIFVRRIDKKNGKLVNTIVKTYPNVSQFWTYDEKWFLSQPVYSRNYPPLKS
jgi:branched-chain amino acid transport system substrate-binding protein